MKRTIGPAALVLFLTAIPGPARADDIFSAAKRGDLFTVRHYLRKDPDSLSAPDESGFTPLHWAGIRAQWEVFADLVERGAAVNAVGGDGGTPLHWACHHDRPDMIRLLLDRGADVNLANRWGRTPLHVAARRGCDLTASLLLDRGADLNAVTREGWTPLHVAYEAGQPRMVGLLLARGASPDVKDNDGRRPRDHAMERPPEVAIDPAKLGEYAGRYGQGLDVLAKTWVEKGKLRIIEYAPDELYPVGPDTFFCRREPWEVRFTRNDDDGEIEAVEIDFLRRTVSAPKMPVYEYVGSRRCSPCHLSRETGSQQIQWMQSRHAAAYWRLATDWAKFLASVREEYTDIENPIEEQRCLKCHVTGAQDLEGVFAADFRVEEGVGCESCHGPGSAYIDPEIMADRERFLANGGRVPDEATCRQCHQNDSFSYEDRLPKIAHPRPLPAN